MNKKEFIETIKLSHQCEALDDGEGFRLFVDGFLGDFFFTINPDETLNIKIDVYDDHPGRDSEFEKMAVVDTLAEYKYLASALESTFGAAYKLSKSRSVDDYRGLVYTVGFICEGIMRKDMVYSAQTV